MHQQINLYQPVFRKQQKVFSALTLLQISAAVLFLLLAIVAHARWALADLDATADGLDLQLTELQSRLGTLEETYRTPDTELIDTQIETLVDNIDQRHYLLEQFDRLIIQHRGGFAAQFESLAQLQVPGLWLEGVTVTQDNRMEIRGIALEPRLVPLYLQQLEQRGNLPGSAFETVSMSRIADDRPHIQFVLRNSEENNTWQ